MSRPATNAAHHSTDRTRDRALEIVCTLYRCPPEDAAPRLVQLSQTNNLKVSSLAKALVAVVDDATNDAADGTAHTAASHFWLREIRNLSQIHRRSDHLHRHGVARQAGVN